MRAITPKTVEHARRNGYRLGLRISLTILRRARNHHVQKMKKAGKRDPDLWHEHDFAANVLQALYLELAAELKKSKVNGK